MKEFPIDELIAESDKAWEPMNSNQSCEYASYRALLDICKQLHMVNEKLSAIHVEIKNIRND